MTVIRLPYLNEFTDSRGKLRRQFRRKGHPRVTIKGVPGSEEFMAHYHELLAKSENRVDNINSTAADRARAGSIDALVADYLQHDTFTKGLAKASQQMRKPILNKFRDATTPSGRRYGDNRLRTMPRQNIESLLAGKTYSVQTNWIKALRHLFKFAIERGETTVDLTAGMKPVREGGKSQGYMTWKAQHVEQFRSRHPIGSMPRLALELMLNTAGRRNDIYQLGPDHMTFNAEIQRNVLTWRPTKTARKTGKVLAIPVLPSLQEALDAMGNKLGNAQIIQISSRSARGGSTSDTNKPCITSFVSPFLTNTRGQPFASAAVFGNVFRQWCREAELPTVMCADGRQRDFRAHGLRKHALYSLFKAGASTAQLQAIGGHSSLAELQKYVQEVEQDELAISAMELMAKAQVRVNG